MTRVLPALLLLLAGEAGAQLRELQPGARVRVTAPTVLRGKLEAMIVGRRGDTLSILPHGDTLSILPHDIAPFDIPISALSRIEIYRGKSRAAGVKNGLLWGLAIGFPVGLATAPGDNKTWNETEQVMLTTVGTGAIGAGIGALIGRARWETLHAPALPVVSIQRSGVLIGTRVWLPF